MKRREFIKNSCAACISVTALGVLFTSCKSGNYIQGKMNNDGLLVDKEDFKVNRNGKVNYRPYIIVRNEELKYPVCVYRLGESEYSAVWMQCSHQGAELQASGDFLQCPAHGSEFDNRGTVTNGPADRDLRTFPVTITNNQLFIDLRKK